MHWHRPAYINNQGFIHTLHIMFQPKTHNKSPFLICWIITNSLFSIMSKVFLLMPTIPKLYQPPRFIISHAKFVTPHTYICNQLIIYKSCRDHANFHTKPIICNSGIILRIPHTPLYTYHSSYIHTQPKQTIQEQTNIQSQHCLAQHLAQARQSRSDEAPSA